MTNTVNPTTADATNLRYNLGQIGRTRLPFAHLSRDTLDWYERQGWIVQERDGKRRRNGYCDLTEAGRVLAESK